MAFFFFWLLFFFAYFIVIFTEANIFPRYFVSKLLILQDLFLFFPSRQRNLCICKYVYFPALFFCTQQMFTARLFIFLSFLCSQYGSCNVPYNKVLDSPRRSGKRKNGVMGEKAAA